MKFRPLRWFRQYPYGLVLAIVFIPALTVAATIGADRLGYCVNDILPGNAGLNADPYVQDVTTDSATIVWRSAAEREGAVRFQADDGSEYEVQLPAAELQIAPLTGLEPATSHEYEVEWGSQKFSGSFTTAPADGAAVSIAVIGDSGTRSDAQYEIARQLVAAQPDLVLHTGDVVYRRGALCHYGTKFFTPYGELIGRVPVYPAAGNHDLMANDGRAYFETFVLPANNPAGIEEYYSFDYGPAHIVSINSEFYERGDESGITAQREWLEADLAASELPWTIVFMHRPPYSSTDGKDSPALREDLSPVFASHGVDLVLSGHAHNYERSIPIDGVTYIVTGGGGAGLHDLDPSSATAAAAKAHHFLQIEISENRLTATSIDGSSEPLDSVEMTK